MCLKLLKLSIFSFSILLLSACGLSDNTEQSNENLVNKVNTISSSWKNYKGFSEYDRNMMQSQFIPYNPDYSYEVTQDTYASYFNGDKFIKTELYEDTPVTIDKVEEADGIVLSFNKENRSGMQLTKTSEP